MELFPRHSHAQHIFPITVIPFCILKFSNVEYRSNYSFPSANIFEKENCCSKIINTKVNATEELWDSGRQVSLINSVLIEDEQLMKLTLCSGFKHVINMNENE